MSAAFKDVTSSLLCRWLPFIAALTNVGLPHAMLATVAVTGSLISGITSFQALLEAHWSSP